MLAGKAKPFRTEGGTAAVYGRDNLFRSQPTLKFDFVRATCTVCDLNWNIPHQRLNTANAGIVFTAIEQR